MASNDSGLRFTEKGSGDPVVLLDWTPWDSATLGDALADKYRVISIEPPVEIGSGRSADEVARAVAAAAEAAGLDSYALAGTSVGANVAFRVALLQPDSVSTLVLVSPDCVRPATGQPWNTPELAALAMLAHPEAPGQPLPDPDRTAVLSALAEGSRTTDGDVAQLLPELGCATLVVFGQEDRLVSRDAGGTWKAQVPNCNVCYVYDAGHAVGMDRPDALANVVLDFVERRETFIVENRTSLINP